jgi:hypothetical protein
LRPISARRAKERAKALFMLAAVLCRWARRSVGRHVEGRILGEGTVERFREVTKSYIFLPHTRQPYS